MNVSHLKLSGFILFLFNYTISFAQSPIQSATVTHVPGVTKSYNQTGWTGAGCSPNTYSSGTNYHIQFGQGNNRRVDAIVVGGQTYNFSSIAGNVKIRRNTSTGRVSYNPFFEKVSLSGTTLRIAGGYAATSEEALNSRYINRGIDAIFSCTNARRWDYIFTGTFAVSSSTDLSKTGFPVFERAGNDAFKIAAITGLDNNGDPNCFGNLITVNTSDWGNSLYYLNSVNFEGNEGTQSAYPEAEYGGDVKGVFISLQDLGITAGQQIYGYAIFDTNVSTSNSNACHTDLINWNSYPSSGQSSLDVVASGMLVTTSTVVLQNCTGPDSDGDGYADGCDLDDDNDGILDEDECPQPTSSGISGHITGFTYNISSTNPSDNTVPHTLNSITYNGITYTDFVVPDAVQTFFTLSNTNGVRFTENGVETVFNYTNPNYDQDILPVFQSRNLNAYQALDFNNFADGDYFDLSYNNPILSTAGGFVAVTERNGNNPQVLQALDVNGNVVGTTIHVQTSHYVDVGHNVMYGVNSPQNSQLALYPIEDLAPVGTLIYGLRVSFGASATGDGPDAKAFFFGNSAIITCDYDGDGIPNDLDLDSDNDGCFDAIEGGASFTSANLNADGRLTITSVNSNGVPNVITNGQTVGTSQNENSNPCPEICNNGIDDDGDGFVDCNDNDCTPAAPGTIQRN